jgi:hypothetical protein
MRASVEKSLLSLKHFVERKDFKGWDPYDGLNSRYFQRTFLRKNAIARLAWIQLFKRSPYNLRKLFKVNEGYNAKGLGLFLGGYCNLYRITADVEYLQKIKYLTEKIIAEQTLGYSGACWGYNFDWQARAFFQPRGTPTVVATTYVAYALLDAYDILKDQQLLKIARSSCDFILKDLNRTYDPAGDFCFSYSPLDHTKVFNASLLGSRLLARVYSYTGEAQLVHEAKRSAHFCCKHQKTDGSWPYGTLPFHHWIDNFHTGFNLECLSEYERYSGDASFKKNLNDGLRYYLNNFFLEDGRSKYYNNKLYPIDIHAPAQLIVTLYRLELIDDQRQLINRVLGWTIDHMQDRAGYFYYQMKKYFNSKIPYMRWAQAWMFFSLSLYLLKTHDAAQKN